jgi:flagellar biosynthesis/type III secretory pathway M-ring protein FliF/YscJ
VATGGGAAAVSNPNASPRYMFREADTEIRDKVVSTVVDHPEAAARLVKAWLKDS